MSDYSELKKQAEAAESALKRLDKPEDLQLELVVRGKSRPELAELTAIATFWEKSSPGAVLGLIAESERLERNRDMWKAQVERQAQEMTALRQDAERYRWLRSQHWNESDMAVVCHPKTSVKLGFDCPSGERLDDAIDVAMNEQPGED